MDGHLVTIDGTAHELDAGSIRALLGESTPFWLDLVAPTPEESQSLLGETFGFHPLAVEDAQSFGERPKLDSYDDFTFLVVYGATGTARLVEVHCFYTEQFLVTVHHDPCPELAELARRLPRLPGERRHTVVVLHRVVDTLVDSYFPVLADMDDRIDELEDEILERPTEEQLGRLFDLKRSLIAIRKVVTPQRDLFATVLSGRDLVPGMTPEAEHYFRDLYDHLIRISDLVDSYRDLMTGALDTHLSTVSNRLNVVMKQLTIIATIFLPLSFLTGFFGQNFAWMVKGLDGPAAFAALGLGLQVVVAGSLIVMFRRRGWLSSDGMAPGGAPAGRRRRLARDQRSQSRRPSPVAAASSTTRGPGD